MALKEIFTAFYLFTATPEIRNTDIPIAPYSEIETFKLEHRTPKAIVKEEKYNFSLKENKFYKP